MPISDDELLARHNLAEGADKDLLAELMRARKSLAVAQKLSQLGPLLDTSLFTMQLQGHAPLNELYLGILHKKPDGSGRVGPSWPLGEFHQDLKQLAELLLVEEQQMDLKAAMIGQIFGGG